MICAIMLFGMVPGISADPPDPTPVPYAIPTPLPRVYTQAEINTLLELIEARYAIGFAYPGEWQAGSAAEVMLLTKYLHYILESLNIAAHYLHIYGNAPPETTPQEFFREHFAQANIMFDRAGQIEGGFDGNTLPVYEDGGVIGYHIQLAPGSLVSAHILVHELGHVVDNLLDDAPQRAFVRELGGEYSSTAWIPGEGYQGNEILFPRAVAGPNEDFADTFARMITGVLTPENVQVRYDFMLKRLPGWLAWIRNLPEKK